MPANKKHLSSTYQRLLKITAGIIGGYMVTVLVHNTIGIFLENKAVIALTSTYSAFIMWVGLMIWAFMSKSGGKIWLLFITIIIVCSAIIYFFK